MQPFICKWDLGDLTVAEIAMLIQCIRMPEESGTFLNSKILVNPAVTTGKR